MADNIVTKKVDNRVLILALDYLYRESMKQFEKEVLLGKSRILVNKLSLSLIDIPIEGYYYESDELKEYFLKIRTLQNCPAERKYEVEGLESYQMLSRIMSSEIYGKGNEDGFFPRRLDSLFYALDSIPINEWSVKTITEKAQSIAIKNDDISLVGIAASINDSVVLTALRESVALYAMVALGCAEVPPKMVYQWNVDSALQIKVDRFIRIFNELTASNIKNACSENVEYFYKAFEDNEIIGRCIRIGIDDSTTPEKNYHWAITHDARGLVVDDFWSKELWTTERYQDEKLYSL